MAHLRATSLSSCFSPPPTLGSSCDGLPAWVHFDRRLAKRGTLEIDACWLLVGCWLVVGWLLVGCWLVVGWLLLVLVVGFGCWFWLLVLVVGFGCWFWLLVLVVVVGCCCCCWLLLLVVAVGCCWLLLVVVGCCWLLLLLLLLVVVGCCCCCCWSRWCVDLRECFSYVTPVALNIAVVLPTNMVWRHRP